MNYSDALLYLKKREKFGINLNLSNIKKAVQSIGNPQNKLKAIHIAGTNGKGSCAAMVSEILKEAGFTVGLYTSPHLVDFRERIQINRKCISKGDFTRLANRVQGIGYRVQVELTYFEFLTLLAFAYFKEKNVDFAVLETGMGGRLDATNVVRSSEIKNNRFNYYGIFKDFKNLELGIKGFHQIENASLAIGAIELLNLNPPPTTFESLIKIANKSGGGPKRWGVVPERAIRRGLKKTFWPGRLELRRLTVNGKRLTVLLDGAHNPSAIRKLKEALREFKYRNLILILGILKDKDIKNILVELFKNPKPELRTPNSQLPVLSEVEGRTPKLVIVTSPKNERACKKEILARKVQKFISPGKVLIKESVESALKNATQISTPKDLILVTGSLYTVGEAKRELTRMNNANKREQRRRELIKSRE